MIKDKLFSFAYFLRALKHLCKSVRVIYSNEHRGEICVLGNGPSLNSSLSTLIRANKKFFVVNDFAVSKHYIDVRPNYYVMVDPFYWDEKINSFGIEMRERVFNNMNSLTTWKMELFVPDYVVRNKFLNDVINNSNISVRGFNYTNFYPTYTKFYMKILKKNYGVVPVGNVLGQAIYLSINLGYDLIRVFGAEHSWTKDIRVNEKNEVCTIKRHFFSNEEVLEPWHKSNGELFKMHEILYSLMNHFSGYFFLNWYAERLNRRIVNCTKDSFIDAFERCCCDYEEEL